MKEAQRKCLPADTDEWIRLLQTDDGHAAREHLAAGRAIYYRETDTPAGLCVKKYPGGRREWITFDRKTGREFIVRTLNEDDPTRSPASPLALHGDDAGLGFGPPLPQHVVVTEEGLVGDAVDETMLDRRLDEIASSTQKANDALDDALAFIAASNLRIDKIKSEPDKG